MVNNEQFAKRLSEIINYYDLSAASFADKIEVGRSSISHILSGRNKPSLDFVLKIVSTFPEVELYWLLNGKGDFPKNKNENSPTPIDVKKSQFHSDLFSESEKIPQQVEKMESTGNKRIQRVVIFYNDGTFEAYEENR